jgi:hypothetical protein
VNPAFYEPHAGELEGDAAFDLRDF